MYIKNNKCIIVLQNELQDPLSQLGDRRALQDPMSQWGDWWAQQDPMSQLCLYIQNY